MSHPVFTMSVSSTTNQVGQHRTQALSDYLGQTLVLYFYPKDSTPGCTNESLAFRDQFAAFQACNARILGVSRDSLKAHDRFKANLELPFELISDADEALCQLFDVIKQKMMYGKTVRGIERSTFVFDPQGNLVQEWRKVKVENHVNEVLQCVQGLS